MPHITHDIFKLNGQGTDKRGRTKIERQVGQGKVENSVPHPRLSLCKTYPLPTSFLTLPPLHAVSIYSSMKGSDRRVICMIAFFVPCINSAVQMNN